MRFLRALTSSLAITGRQATIPGAGVRFREKYRWIWYVSGCGHLTRLRLLRPRNIKDRWIKRKNKGEAGSPFGHRRECTTLFLRTSPIGKKRRPSRDHSQGLIISAASSRRFLRMRALYNKTSGEESDVVKKRDVRVPHKRGRLSRASSGIHAGVSVVLYLEHGIEPPSSTAETLLFRSRVPA